MHRRKWNAKTKLLIVLQGLQGKPVAELCTEPQISQSLYDQWRDPFLANATKAFEGHQQSQKEARLARENARLKTLVGELTRELKKSDEVLG
jgi:transposase-like protein